MTLNSVSEMVLTSVSATNRKLLSHIHILTYKNRKILVFGSREGKTVHKKSYYTAFSFVYISMHGRREWVLGSKHKRIEWPVRPVFPDYLSVSYDYVLIKLHYQKVQDKNLNILRKKKAFKMK